ncbi:hypothetical protein ACS3QZ_05890 [Shimia sp. W99]|uniref:Uncharacterized protein n=1 Tax=Shimia aestuarii TaxID=254406 RepID=A0A1I4TLB3_9RHOB|nr:hypothetical protein [Shimia aestuarii]SFM77347.1 hypothetical protein SAMN04488042_1188 [Shimia aestuarii]
MTNVEELLVRASEIEGAIHGATGDDRYNLHQQLHRTLENIRLRGGRVPGHLRKLDLDLVEEEIEASFDNMPI